MNAPSGGILITLYQTPFIIEWINVEILIPRASNFGLLSNKFGLFITSLTSYA